MTPKQIGIIGATFTGNHGAEAMLNSLIQALQAGLPVKPQFHVFSYYPREDRACNLPENVTIRSATPLRVAIRSAMALLIPGRMLKGGSRLDILLDIAGVSFIDQRLKFLPYNVLTLAPFLRDGIPIVKCPQAMGPFRNPLNRFFAKTVLEKCLAIFSRGEMTTSYLRELELSKACKKSADLAFLLKPAGEALPVRVDGNLIGIAVSSLLARKHHDYVEKMIRMACVLRRRGFGIELLCHSWRANCSRSRNNDVICAERIRAGLTGEVPVRGVGMNAAQLKRQISSYDFLVTSRFHALIAGLSMHVPSFVIGWSHKYDEILEDFGIAEMSCRADCWDPEDIATRVDKLFSRREKLSAQIQSHLPRVRDSAHAPINFILQTLENV